MNHYVYVYIDPRNNVPFYVGAGHGKRDVKHLTACHKGFNRIDLRDAAGRLWKRGYIKGFPRKRLLAWDLMYRALKNLLEIKIQLSIWPAMLPIRGEGTSQPLTTRESLTSPLHRRKPMNNQASIEELGTRWTDLGQQFGQMNILSLCYLGNEIALAGTNPDGKILRSTDYGVTWTDLGRQFGQVNILSLCYLGNGIALAGTYPGGKILRSTDYGATWTDLGRQFGQMNILSLCCLGNGIVLAVTYPGGKILCSTNYGATWTDLGRQFGQTSIYCLCYLGNGIALAGTDGKILRSTNYGATWTDLGRQFGQMNILSLCGLGNGIALAGTNPDGKILRSHVV